MRNFLSDPSNLQQTEAEAQLAPHIKVVDSTIVVQDDDESQQQWIFNFIANSLTTTNVIRAACKVASKTLQHAFFVNLMYAYHTIFDFVTESL